MTNDLEARVKRGMAVLDHFYPDWEFRVRPEQVTSIWWPRSCVLSVLGGDQPLAYTRVVDRMFGVERKGQPYFCGFCVAPDDDAALTAAWRAAIAVRRALAAVPLEVPK